MEEFEVDTIIPGEEPGSDDEILGDEKEGVMNVDLEVVEKFMEDVDEYPLVCLVEKRWWNHFCKYVGYNIIQDTSVGRPPELDNTSLSDPICKYALNKDKQEILNFVYVTKPLWDKLSQCYGGGPEFCRLNNEEMMRYQIDLFPCIIRLALYNSSGSLFDEEVFYYNRKMTMEELLEDLKSKKAFAEGGSSVWARLRLPLRIIENDFASTDSSGKSAYFIPEHADKNQLVELPAISDLWDYSLEDLQVPDGDLFTLEFYDDDAWPSGSIPWSTDLFNIGFQIDCMDKYNKWLHSVIVGERDNGDVKEFRLHFFGHDSKHDEWVRITSDDRFRQINDYSNDDVTYRWKGKVEKSQQTKSSNSYGGGQSTSYRHFYSHIDGTPTAPGIVGLRNLGNTCFMNSIIQCFNQTPILKEYLLRDLYKSELNFDNPLGKDGKVATEWAQLVKDIWSGNYTTCVPYSFKRTIGDFNPQFVGYNQQDSQEFLNFLLDGIHEDLNRVTEKPYVPNVEALGRPDHVVAQEAWQGYLARNRSIVVDTLQGQLKSTVICPHETCGKVSVTFDPYMFLSVPVPTDNKKVQVVTWVDYTDEEISYTRYGVKIGKEDNIFKLKNLLKKQIGITCPVRHMKCYDVYSNRGNEKTDDDGISYLSESDDIIVYNLTPINQPRVIEDGHSEKIISILVTNREKHQKSKYSSLIGFPCWVSIDLKYAPSLIQLYKYVEEIAKSSLSQQGYEKIEKFEQQNENSNNEEDVNDESEGEDDDDHVNFPYEIKFVKRLKYRYESDPLEWEHLVEDDLDTVQEITIVWDDENDYDDEKFSMDNRKSDESVPSERRYSYGMKKSQPIPLEECLNSYTQTETLGEDNLWYCSQCKDHRAAKKTMELWSCNDILIIHLKRFKYTKWSREKIDREVIFPLEGLDISQWVVNDEQIEDDAIYDLYGVSNHSGGLGGGHYTAYVKNLVDNEWYDCNDSWARRVHDLDDIVSSEAYVLFYKRRRCRNANLVDELAAKF